MAKRDPADLILARDENPKLYGGFQTTLWIVKGFVLVSAITICLLPIDFLNAYIVPFVRPYWLDVFYSVRNNYMYLAENEYGLSVRYIVSLAIGIYILVVSILILLVLSLFLFSSKIKPITTFQLKALFVNLAGFILCLYVLLYVGYAPGNASDEVSFWRSIFATKWIVLSNLILIIVGHMAFYYVLIATAKLIKFGGRVDHAK